VRVASRSRYAVPALMALLAAASLAQSPSAVSGRELSLVAGSGELLQFGQEVVRVVVAEPRIADAIVVSPREVMITGKGAGRTTVMIWETDKQPARYNVSVTPDQADFDDFRKKLREAVPEGTVDVSGNSETLVLTGQVKDPEQAKRAAALASTRTKNVVNLLEIPPPAEPRQILLEVKFASIDRVALSELGFNYFSNNAKGIGSLSTQQFVAPRFSQFQFQGEELRGTTLNFSDLLNLFAFRPDLNFGATIRALQTRNLLQILAEPNLIAIEGREASFLAGGEFPFPILTATPTGGATAPVITVQFKRFGIQLGFTPTLTAAGAIHLKVAPEVSALDYSNAVTLQGFLIPAISTRRAETEVVLRDGESFAIAGLIDNRVIQTLSRVRGLGDIPILGNLFRSRSTRKSNDELLVVITPRFVKPIPAGERVQMPDMMETFLPTVPEEKAQKGGKKGAKKKVAEPAFVGPHGRQEP
jgi:pilus assembly protein CpaC